MRILMIQPNYHCGGAEIAGNWPPSWSAYIGGALKAAGYSNVKFIDAMAADMPDEILGEIIERNQPDVVFASAITPMIYKAQDTLKIVKEKRPQAKTVLGGIHPTFMYTQVLTEAPWIDYIVRGEGEEITVNLMRSIEAGTDLKDRREIKGIAFLEDEQVVATPAHPPIANLDSLTPDWSLLEWDRYIYIPMNVRMGVPNFARGCPFTCRFCSQWKFWRSYRLRSPKNFVDEVETLVKDYKVGFYILADEEPTINRDKFIAMCQEMIDRKIDVQWGINTRVTDILRDEALLPFYRKAGLMHVSLGTEASTQMNLNRFRKETTIEQNKKAIDMLKANGMVAEAQFIMGLENETPETIEETYKLALYWDADMANWNMYTPWPFSELFEELGDKVQVRDYSKYNFVTPIMQPDAMDREDVLKGVLRSYGRFYLRKSFMDYPFIKDPKKRKYMMGCLKAFIKMTANKRFYDLGRVKQKGFKTEIDLGFDKTKILSQEQIASLKNRPDLTPDINSVGNISACGAPRDLEYKENKVSDISACGAPRDLEYKEENSMDDQATRGMFKI
ncbi:magnesium-protoporphyrin IX monomethyl ester anaerobic oxidative cyclase [Heliophilum fasciatum]|uniref:Anaerobic Mg-protoporphyrin IX monomethyl ester oxidative cyclase n=1 Tax=Heliophilum fasciatum TaxID=35700 RepID=A0A4R2RXY3_9FIRM|nr:magnesium-protoporphyrin IX monomethyl ester anaerobic oxidative cyclase [Heliophilum fasciatum]MCW2277051.1 anaerobic magnesium-protoporphyrin IX monomethyl ester cyclase [Heliophilum fasciatum]TCP68423.1 anaerobic Mg-protoporphyrin IX monomethyl ester oxidative cyclase [Heliophilum fasciatum]